MSKPEVFYPAIDGDGVLYRCAFAAQKRIYNHNGQDFNGKKDLDTYLGHKAKPEEYEFRIEAEPVENALANVKNSLQHILEATKANDYTLYVSSNTETFRDRLARIKPYKGNRADMEKPIHYDACMKYILDVWGAEPVVGIEADDACAIHQVNVEDSVIVSMDKDLRQIPGWHYNWVKPEEGIMYVDEDEARYYKYIQILAGDATDNIEGLPGMGEKKAAKLLQNMYGSTEEEYDEVCLDYYINYFLDEEPNRYIDMSPKQYLDMVLGMYAEDVYRETKQLITIITDEKDIEVPA